MSVNGEAPTVEILIQGLGATMNGIPIAISTVALVRSSVGTILVDTGMHHTRPMLLEQLAKRKLTPDDIDILLLTHLHFDHADNAWLFPNCRRIVHETEIEEATTFPTRDWGLSDAWRETIAVPTLDVMAGPELDLGGGITLHHLPGHRWGMIALAADTSDGQVVCCADVAKNARELLSRTPVVSDPDFAKIGRRSIDQLLELADVVITGHDRPLAIVDGVPQWTKDIPYALSVY
jgi:N-acyl homoserine lactone hydrolase